MISTSFQLFIYNVGTKCLKNIFYQCSSFTLTDNDRKAHTNNTGCLKKTLVNFVKKKYKNTVCSFLQLITNDVQIELFPPAFSLCYSLLAWRLCSCTPFFFPLLCVRWETADCWIVNGVLVAINFSRNSLCTVSNDLLFEK